MEQVIVDHKWNMDGCGWGAKKSTDTCEGLRSNNFPSSFFIFFPLLLSSLLSRWLLGFCTDLLEPLMIPMSWLHIKVNQGLHLFIAISDMYSISHCHYLLSFRNAMILVFRLGRWAKDFRNASHWISSSLHHDPRPQTCPFNKRCLAEFAHRPIQRPTNAT